MPPQVPRVGIGPGQCGIRLEVEVRRQRLGAIGVVSQEVLPDVEREGVAGLRDVGDSQALVQRRVLVEVEAVPREGRVGIAGLEADLVGIAIAESGGGVALIPVGFHA